MTCIETDRCAEYHNLHGSQ